MENTLNARSRSQTLVQAVKNNDITRVEELLNSGMDVNKMYPVVESAFPRRTKIVYKTLLIIACGINIYTQGDNIDMIKLLINYGADVNKHGPGLFSKPPLTECLYSRKEIIELLTLEILISCFFSCKKFLNICLDINSTETFFLKISGLRISFKK